MSAATQTNPAQEAGLIYVTDERPGIQRRRSKYLEANGEPLSDPSQIERINKLAIPPAWQNVWICPSPRGHIQATGRDAKGRKQYIYHRKWRAVRDETKFDKCLNFAKALPKIRKRVKHDLALRGLPRDKVLATIVELLQVTLIRVGNEEYAKQNDSFGLTTLRRKHVRIKGDAITFEFMGKSRKKHKIDLRDRTLAQIVKKSRDLPGQELFEYVDEQSVPQTVTSTDVNTYLREISGEDFTAKDFRTWGATVLAAVVLAELPNPETQTESKHLLASAIEEVANALGNTPAICRKSYIHPSLLEAFTSGPFELPAAKPRRGLSHEEAATLRFLCKASQQMSKPRRR